MKMHQSLYPEPGRLPRRVCRKLFRLQCDVHLLHELFEGSHFSLDGLVYPALFPYGPRGFH